MTESTKGNKGVKNFSTIFACVITLSVVGSGVYAGLIAKKSQDNNLQMLKDRKCVKIGVIQSNGLFSDNQYQYKCNDGVTYTLNIDFNPE